LVDTVVDPYLNLTVNFECKAIVKIFSIDCSHKSHVTMTHQLHPKNTMKRERKKREREKEVMQRIKKGTLT
jgi:hypothetical protein